MSLISSVALVCQVVLRQRRLSAAESPVLLERSSHQPIADGHLDDALAEEGKVQTAEPLQEVNDLRYAAFPQETDKFSFMVELNRDSVMHRHHISINKLS